MKDIDVAMSMCNLIEYSINYSRTSGSLWQNYRHELALTDTPTIADFSAANNGALFKFKQKITGKTATNGREDVE